MSIELDPINSGYQLSKINTNFQRIEDELNNNVLRRDGLATGEDNSMHNNLDMNSHAILNAITDPFNDGSLVTVNEFKRAVRGQHGEVLVELDPPSIRASKLLGFDGAGQPVTVLAGAIPSALALLLASHSPGEGAGMIGLTPAGTVQQAIQWVTPEMFGAVGDGVADDRVPWQNAVNTGLNVVGKSGATYFLGSTVVFPAGTNKQVIDGNGCTIKWTTANDQPFDQYVSGSTRQGYTSYKSYQNLTFNGPVLPKSKFSDFASCHAINYSNGYAKDLVFNGWTNCFRVFGNTFSSNILADNLRNAVWSSRNSNNHISNVKVGWCAGDVIVAYGSYFSVNNVSAEYAGVIPSDTLEASGTPRGSLISTGQDGNASTTFNGILSNLQCNYHGGGGIICSGTNIVVDGSLNIGSVYQATAISTANQLGVWVGGTNIRVGDFMAGTVNSAITIQSGSAGCVVGNCTITGTMVGFNPYVLSAFDDTATPSLISACSIGNIRMEGFVSRGNTVVISTSGLTVGDIYFRSLGNNTSTRTVLLRGACKVKAIRGYNPASSSATGTFIELSDQSGSPYVGEIEAEGIYGTGILVNLGCVPRLGNIYLRTLGNGGLSPLIINNDGSANFFWGSVHLNGALGSNPTMNGTLSMTGFYSPIPWTKVTANTAILKFPTQVTTTL